MRSSASSRAHLLLRSKPPTADMPLATTPTTAAILPGSSPGRTHTGVCSAEPLPERHPTVMWSSPSTGVAAHSARFVER